MPEANIAVIGGSGLDDIDGLSDVEEVKLVTPFGEPSDAIKIGALAGNRIAFLPRHGRGHRLSPAEVPARANIYALKMLGVEQVISVSAVGSMRDEIAPLDIVVPDQILDRTRARPSSFFSDGLVVHIGFADPFCPRLSQALYRTAQEAGVKVHNGGTYVCIDGPQFSTRAESRVYRQWGVDIIGMTALPEAKLAREAEMCYSTLALVTDYDVWHEAEEPVTVEMIISNLLRNVAVAKKVLAAVVATLRDGHDCQCSRALESAIITQWDAVPSKTRERVALLIGKYVPE
ncbi:MAG: S-methyl-5'-thioadenosine phosphorylase [Chloroflexi bacterium]|nr:S-methyl-5'-thioadenosine phosphorylase [Chloroflexota bacterium]